MRKLIAFLAALALLVSAAAMAEEPEAGNDQADIAERVHSFFVYWYQDNPDEMLALCDSGWKSIAADPRAKLAGILAGRTPLDVVIESAARIEGEGPDGLTYYLVTVTSHLNPNDGTDYPNCRIRFLVRKEEDGLWHIDPSGLETCEVLEEAAPAEAVPEAADESAKEDTVLYYQPDGGEYYHLDPNCALVNGKYLPLQGSFLASELNEAPYRDLKPCAVCGADAVDEKDPVSFETFSDATVFMEEGDSYTISDGYAVAVTRRDGRCFRVVAPLDEHAQEMYDAFHEDGDYTFEEYQELAEYAGALPVRYVEELSVVPFSREELDAMAGKTILEVMSEPWELGMHNYPESAEAGKDIVFPMVKGFCEYNLVINEPAEVYLARRDADRYDPVTAMSLRNYLDLTVKRVEYTGISSFNALDLRYQPDGTMQRDIEDYDEDLMEKIADYLNERWKDVNPDRAAKEAMIEKLAAEYPEAGELVRQIVNSFH